MLFVAPRLYEFCGVLMIAQKIKFAVRVIGCLMCDISGMKGCCVNISYVFMEGVDAYVCQSTVAQVGLWKILVVNR